MTTVSEHWTPTPKDSEAAEEFVKIILDTLRSNRGVHAETAVASAARMAGTFLLWSFNLPMDGVRPGSAVFSDLANEQGPELVSVFFETLQALKISVRQSSAQSATPEEHVPHRSLLETQATLGPALCAAADRLGLDDRRAAVVSVMAACLLIRDTVSVLDPNVAAGIALYGFVEGAKTAPAVGCRGAAKSRNLFHLAFPITDLAEAKKFYVEGLGCSLGREAESAVILGLAGHQIVAHLVEEPLPKQKGVYPRHFGLIFTSEKDWQALADRAKAKGLTFYQQPKTRFEGKSTEHRTFFLEDPSHNLLEFKFYVHESAIFGEQASHSIGDKK
jgi:extradiol dioxygenase family protein